MPMPGTFNSIAIKAMLKCGAAPNKYSIRRQAFNKYGLN
jgi:hypothetical protein